MKKNVLFIVIDSVTNDILFNKNTSSLCAPFLNELRKKSISGDKMFSEAPYTEAALMCLLGGIDTMDNGGYMERFKDKTCVLEVFRNNGYKVFYNNYYPSIYPSYMAPGYDERKYIEGFQFSHIWDYRLKYYSEIFEKNEINNKEYKILADMLDDNFKNWIIYLEKIRDKDSETSMLNGNIDVSDIDNDIKQIKVEYEKFSKDNKKYLNSLFEQKENHQLFNIKTYMMSDKVHDNIVRNKVIEKYKTTFDRINKMNFENNLLNNKLPIKNIIKSIINKDFKTAKGLLAGYKNSLFDKDLYDRISNNYDQFKVQRSFYTVSQELFVWIKENKDKKWMSYVHIDDAHFPENFFTYDTKDLKLIEEDFKRINTYLNNIPKGYKGSISYDLSLMYCDNVIKNIFKFLEKEKILNDTSIVITADHGFSYYFSPVREKYVISSYRENYNVPFIVWSKDIKNKMINNYCSTKDIPVTLLDLVDIKIPKVFKGQSLLESKGQDYALLEYMGGGCPDIYRRPIILGVRTDNYDVVMEVYINKKFIDNEIKEVYNIRKDPFEYDNLFKQENIKEKIKKELIKDFRFLSKLWYEDFNFTTKILFNTDKISNISEGFYHCNCGHESTMNNNNSKKNLDMIIIMDDIINYLKENKKYDENIVSYLIFDHVLITTINRLTFQKSKDKKETINIFLKYCKDNISNYTKLPFYNKISRNRKIIAWLNYHDLYNVSKIILLLKGKMKG